MKPDQLNTADRRAQAALFPAAFVSHGSPMVAIETGPYQEALAQFGAAYRPKAVVVVSAHWDSGDAVRITSAGKHTLMYDFGGFPEELFTLTYEAVGDPALAARVLAMLTSGGVPSVLDPVRPLDHGAWIPLRLMYPNADIPVVEVSFPGAFAPAELIRMGSLLSPLRDEQTLILGSGGIVHNLRRLDWHNREASPQAWALDFDRWVSARLDSWDIDELLRYQEAAPSAAWAVPTNEHFHPLFIALGAAGGPGRVTSVHEGFEYGTLSMRCIAIRRRNEGMQSPHLHTVAVA
jgi:4,5-DOPA dioxygenase extradiol